MRTALLGNAEADDLPLIVDADTGFGNAMNSQRTMRMLENSGATAIEFALLSGVFMTLTFGIFESGRLFVSCGR